MNDSSMDLSAADYNSILAEYLETRSENALYRASILSQVCIESGLGPEDIVALHFESLDAVLPNHPYREHTRVIGEAHQFLLEVMIAYGVKYKEYLELKVRDSLRDAEARATHERERALEAERLQREKTEILAVIAHEMRTPITVARGNLDLASRSLSQGKVDPATRMLGSAREALDRLSRLSADLVEASRGEAPEIEMTAQDLSPILFQACQWVRPVAEAKGIVIEYIDDGPRFAVAGNRDGLLSVFGNLLSNAVRYTPAPGKVKIEVIPEQDMVAVAVRDTGIGMAPEVQARVFDKFYRGPEARSIEAKGLGLGLSLVRQIVNAHGGDVTVESAPGQGSVFRVYLPVLTAE